MYVCVYVYVYMYVCMYVYIHKCVCVYIYIYIYILVYVFLCVYVCVCMYVCMYVFMDLKQFRIIVKYFNNTIFDYKPNTKNRLETHQLAVKY